jgi:cell division protein FtsI/penicillin-binding protein 2
MLGRTDSRRRLLTLLVVFAVAGGALVVRLGYWQVLERDRLVASADRQMYVQTEIPSRRGEIYDRTGTVLIAGTVTRDRLIMSAAGLDQARQDATAAFLVDRLGLTDVEAAALRMKLASGKPYVVLAKGLAPEQTDAIRAAAVAAGIDGLSVESEYARQYAEGGTPEGSLAAHLIGFVNQDGQGQYGVEQSYQDVLAGESATVEADRDATGDPIADTEHVIDPGVPGVDLRLTIDAGLQSTIEQEVMAARIADDAEMVSAVVMDPRTGEVYAEASYPSYDANAYASVAAADPRRFVDPVISDVYEPGSVFKLLTVIAALEQGTAVLTDEYDDTGSMLLDGGRTRIWDSDHTPMHEITLQDAIAYSRNVVAARVALGLGDTTKAAATTLFDVWQRLGFGARTGIDLAGEAKGIVNDPAISAWRQIDLANGSFGQGVAVTPIQLATAYSAMVNGGTLVTPHVVAAVGGQAVAPVSRGQALAPSLSPTLMDLLHYVATSPRYRAGTNAPGYWLGGKTGTAQIWDAPTQSWRTDRYDFSFVGFIGRREGQADLVVAIRIHAGKPKVAGQLALNVGSHELFRRIATDAITVPGLLPELPPDPLDVAKVGA